MEPTHARHRPAHPHRAGTHARPLAPLARWPSNNVTVGRNLARPRLRGSLRTPGATALTPARHLVPITPAIHSTRFDYNSTRLRLDSTTTLAVPPPSCEIKHLRQHRNRGASTRGVRPATPALNFTFFCPRNSPLESPRIAHATGPNCAKGFRTDACTYISWRQPRLA